LSANAPRLLNDAQVQQFICDGFLVLSPEVPAAVHEAAYAKLQWMMDEDYNPGNNILPRVPEMQQVLDAPDVRGALASVLGADYVLHPHRFCHSNLPGVQTEDGPKVGAGSTSFVGWHQDSHSPLSKPRHHYPRYAMLLYYPQDTPPELGPTQLIPGTQYNRSISDEERARGMQASGPAGTCVLVHFDVAHGGSLNVGAYCRHMVKFVFARVSEPQEPSWNCRSSQWQRPDSVLNPHDQEITWQRIWHWLSGDAVESAQKEADVADADRVAEQIELLQAENPLEQRLRASSSLGFLGAAAAEAVPALIDCFVAVEPLRQNAIYALAAIGAPAIPALVARIEDRSVGKWSEGAFVLEDSAYALAAMGKGAMPALVELAEHQSEWIRINALFALGEMGAAAITCVPLLKAALADPSHKIVRTALDALGQMGAGAAALLPDIAALLQMEKAEWTELLQRDWNGGDQVRVNAALALLRLGSGAAGVEDVLEKALGDSCGYVDGFAIEGLLRLQTPSALSKAVHHLRTHRWDDTLIRNVRTF
jgi:HEAT repeat protein